MKSCKTRGANDARRSTRRSPRHFWVYRKRSREGGIKTATWNLCNKSWIKHAACSLSHLWTLWVSNHPLVGRSRMAREMHSHHGEQDGESHGCHRVIVFWHWSSSFSRSLLLYSLFSILSCVQSSLPLSYSPLADSLTGFVPLANHSALIMRIISSHHSPRCASSISSGPFAHHQTLPISRLYWRLRVFVARCAAHTRGYRASRPRKSNVLCFYKLIECVHIAPWLYNIVPEIEGYMWHHGQERGEGGGLILVVMPLWNEPRNICILNLT